MNTLVASRGDFRAVARGVASTFRRQGWSVLEWDDPSIPPPENTTAYDFTVFVGEFSTIHNPWGRRIWVEMGTQAGETPFTECVADVAELFQALKLADAQEEQSTASLRALAPSPPKVAAAQLAPAFPGARARFSAQSLDLASLPPTRFVGPLRDVSGYGEAARHQMWALASAGLRIVPHCIEAGDSYTDDCDFWRALAGIEARAKRLRPQATVYHLPPDVALRSRVAGEGPHICAPVWETTRIPQEWVSMLNQFDAVWCPTVWQADVFRVAGVERVSVVPFWLDRRWYSADGPARSLPGGARREGETVFYSIFQWSERKAPEALLAAWCCAFTDRDNVRLVLKTNTFGQGFADGQRVHDALNGILDSYQFPPGTTHAPVELLVEQTTRERMLALHRACDVYVSLHRGEGWGLPIHEALLMGRSAVFTAFGATEELWSSAGTGGDGSPVSLVPCTLTPVRNLQSPWFRIDQLWAEPDVWMAAHMMRDRVELRCATRPVAMMELPAFVRYVQEAYRALGPE